MSDLDTLSWLVVGGWCWNIQSMHSLFPVFLSTYLALKYGKSGPEKLYTPMSSELIYSECDPILVPFLLSFFLRVFAQHFSRLPLATWLKKGKADIKVLCFPCQGESVIELQIFPNCYAQYFPFFVQHFFLVLVLHLVRHHTRPLLICSRHWSGSGKPNLREPVVNWVPVVIQGGCLVVELIIGCHLHHE